MSVHLVVLHRCRPGVEADASLRHWREVHGPRVAALQPVRAYVRDVVLPGAGAPLAWLGADEIWVEDDAAAAALLADPPWRDGPFAVAEAVCLRTEDHVVVAGAPILRGEALPKRMTFLRRKAGTSREQLLQYWREVHGPLAGASPGVRRYVQSAVLAPEAGRGDVPFDGVAQIWLHDEPALRDLVGSSWFRDVVKPDEANFVATEHNVTLAVREERVMWPGR